MSKWIRRKQKNTDYSEHPEENGQNYKNNYIPFDNNPECT